MKNKHLISLFALAAIVTGFIYFGSNASAQKFDVSNNTAKSQTAPLTNTPQTLPFSQDWTTNLITANDDWGPIPGIQGFLGQDIVTATGVDPRNILAPASLLANDLDVIANQTNPDTLASGGVAEFDTIANPSVALNGSGTGDVPHIILYLNTTGQSNIRVQFDARDLDASVDNSIQQVNTQYRVGNTGNFINVFGGYIADASGGPSTATLTTHVDVTLPAAANNQPEIQVRILTTNAVGNDEWIGIDNILVNTAATPAPNRTIVDFNGDGRSDYCVVRNIGGQIRWFYNTSGTGAATVALDWGLAASDVLTPADFDGDGKTDVAVWRDGAPTVARFFILQSATNTVRSEAFGQTGDDPTVVADYNGDGKTDLAVYRAGATAGAQSTWFYRITPNGPVTYVPWGSNGDRISPGDYDGDGKADFVIVRNNGSGQNAYWMSQSTAGFDYRVFGSLVGTMQALAPGDYDGDGKTDLAIGDGSGATGLLTYQPSTTGTGYIQFSGANPMTDELVAGDYDGDGRADISVWRNDGTFWIRNSSNGNWTAFQLGSAGDGQPASNFVY